MKGVVRLGWWVVLAGLGTVGALQACGTTNSDSSEFGNNTSRDAGRDASSNPLDASAGGNGGHDGSAPAPDGPIYVDGSSQESSLNADSACAATHVEAQPIPLDLNITADRSSSMDNGAWDDQSAALNAFFTAPESAGITVALTFFPYDGSCESDNEACPGDHYFKPKVQWGVLPDHAQTLARAIAQTEPDGCTPTQDALNGVLRGARDRQIDQPNRTVAAVIVSDGEPCCGMCNIEDASGLGQIAARYASGNPPIKTFAIYVADSANDVMSAIARQGGTDHAYDATGGTQAFLAALNNIRQSLMSCEFKMPTTDAGTADPSLLQVEYTPGGASASELVQPVRTQADCSSTTGGWYYDDPNNPTRILLCPFTCQRVQDDDHGKVDVLLGCEPPIPA